MERQGHYVYGNAAPKLPQRVERPEPERKRVPREEIQRRHVSAYARVPKAKLFFGVIMLSAMSFFMLYRFSVIADLNTRMGSMTQQLNELKDQNRILKVDIETSINLDKVKLQAEEQLGMHKPDKFQVVPVSVPKNDYSVVLDQKYIQNASGENKSFIQNALEAISAAFP